MAFHFYKTRKAGGVIIPGQQKEKELVPTVPNLVLRELVVALVVLSFIFILSVFLDAPLRERANPAYSPNPAKAPWYFMGIQELIMHFHPFFAVVLIPLLILFFLFYLPFLKYDRYDGGVWFSSSKGKQLTLISALTALALTPMLVIADEYLFHLATWLPDIPSILVDGIIPFVLIIGAILLFHIIEALLQYKRDLRKAIEK